MSLIYPKQNGLTEAVADLPAGGAVPLPLSVELYRDISVAQSTAGQSVTLPSPDDTSIKWGVTVTNTGTAPFFLYDSIVRPGLHTVLSWDGAAWIDSSRRRGDVFDFERPHMMTPPDGFDITDHVANVIRTKHGFYPDQSVESLRPVITGNTYYIDDLVGDDANPGTEALPFKSPNAAFTAAAAAAAPTPDSCRFMIAPGIYGWVTGFYNSFNLLPATASVAVERWNRRSGDVFITSGYFNPWLQDGVDPTLYSAIVPFPLFAVDFSNKDKYGSPLRYEAAATKAECALRPGTFWIDTSITNPAFRTMHVHPVNPGEPGRELHGMRESNASRDFGARTTYLKGLTYIGGVAGGHFMRNTTGVVGGLALIQDCKFLSGYGNGLALHGIEKSLVVDCVANSNRFDGFYHFNNGGLVPGSAMEVDCEAHGNGWDSTFDAGNGYTTHLGGSVVRLNCKASGNRGPNFADVNANTTVWQLGCVAKGSESRTEQYDNGFLVATGARAWLHECVAINTSADISAETGAELLHHSTHFVTSTDVGATLGTYRQI